MEYTAIQQCYRHYLASNRSSTEVENALQIVQNLHTLSETLHNQKLQLQDFNKNTSNEKTAIIQGHQDNIQAIVLFNKDRRFSITE